MRMRVTFTRILLSPVLNSHMRNTQFNFLLTLTWLMTVSMGSFKIPYIMWPQRDNSDKPSPLLASTATHFFLYEISLFLPSFLLFRLSFSLSRLSYFLPVTIGLTLCLI